MKIVVAGGTGFIGSALCRALAASGHEAAALTRKPPKNPSFEAVAWDGSNPGDWQRTLEGAHAIVNLAGESVAQGRWTRARKEVLRESRLLPTRTLVKAISAAKARPRVFISASAVGYYGNRGDEELNEDSSAGSDFLARLCADWEAEALKAPDQVRVVCLRIGIVLGKEGGALAKMLPPFKLGLGGPLGSGAQWMSWISREDLVNLILHLLQNDVAGPVNATAPNPATNRDFSAALGRVLNRPSWLPAPAFALRLALGELAEMLLSGQKVLPEKALKSNYSFRHPDIDSALKAALR